MTLINIMAGFSTTGVYPVDRNKVISKSMYTPSKQATAWQTLIFAIADTHIITIEEPEQ